MGKGSATDSRTRTDDEVREVEKFALGPQEKSPPRRKGQDDDVAYSPTAAEPDAADNTVPMHDPEVKYDLPGLRTFLAHVFHAGLAEGEDPFVQIHRSAPAGFGSTVDEAFNARLERTSVPMPAYFSTSGLAYDGDVFRHTKDAFKSFRVLVLDDVGTKIPQAKIPDTLAENYSIESSQGNFQLGYILREPITDYNEAQALINLFVDAGYTDGGGAMPVKKVRLPCGVNGKKGDKGKFKVTLHHLDDQYWDIQELLDAAGIDVDWEEYRVKAQTAAFKTRRIGATAWVPSVFYANPQTGVFDPVLEFMYEQGMVVQDGQEAFMDVICPFHDDHTEKHLQAKMCGYSPLGHGRIPNRRVFHCFHDSCKDYTSRDFILRLHLMGGPLMPVDEYRPENVVNMVYDTINDKVYDLSEKGRMHGRLVAVINRITPKVAIPGVNGEKMVDQLPLWLKQPSCVKVTGAIHDASERSRMLRDEDGQLRVNLFSPVEWEDINTPDERHVKMFEDFLTYLIPDDEERDYLRQWIAAKVKWQDFRGAAIVLVSQAQGTGKNTLMKILDRLFKKGSTAAVTLDDLVSGAFNEWAMKPFVNVNEALASDDIRSARRSYNRLKELVDPAPQPVTVNPKYGSKIDVMCSTSFLFFSNHLDAVYLHKGDRRFYGVMGPRVPASGKYFGDLYEWIENENWMPHLWAYLSRLHVDRDVMMQAPPKTATMREVEHEAKSELEAVIDAAIDCWDAAFVPQKVIMDLLPSYVPRGVPENYRIVAKRLLADRLRSIRTDKKLSKYARTRDLRFALKPEHVSLADADESVKREEHERARVLVEEFDESAFREAVDARLIAEGFEF